MPIEIRELVIKATVEESASANGSASATGKGNISSGEDIIKACVDRVLEIIKEKTER